MTNRPMAAAPVGAFLENSRCQWRVWAPYARTVHLHLDNGQGACRVRKLKRVDEDWFTATEEEISVGQRYAFSLNGGPPRPDPASRWQPDGVHAPSAVWSSADFSWSDQNWAGVGRGQLVIYELHVGTMTAEGTFAAIIPLLDQIRDLGVTAVEIMPVGQFPGRRNWGYDGVYWYAVQQSYGGPTEFQKFVDACHAHGLAVILDVVYNHLGPEGNYLGEFGPYFNDHYRTPWGQAINFDATGSDAVRGCVLNNVRYWLRDFHVDGLRLDAIHHIYDLGPKHILAEIQEAAEEEEDRRGIPVHVIGESDLNDIWLLKPPEQGGCGLTGQWADDFHHSINALLTGERNGYYADFDEPAEQLLTVLRESFAFTGQFSRFRGRPHGAPTEQMRGEPFVVCLQNHDQVGNRARSDRLATIVSPAENRLAAALLLLSPFTPLLFMGEEYGEESPFPFFCEFGDGALAAAVWRGRQAEFAEFAWGCEIPNPQEKQTCRSARLTWSWPDGSWKHGLRTLYRDLLRVRREFSFSRDPALRRAELFTADSASILRLQYFRAERGAGSTPDECPSATPLPEPQPARNLLDIFFNLSGAEREFPKEVRPLGPLLLSSEEPGYGGTRVREAFCFRLLPFECVVFSETGTPVEPG